MSEPIPPYPKPGPRPVPEPEPAEFETLREFRPRGILRRLLTTYRHFIGLLIGGLRAYVKSRKGAERRGFGFRTLQLMALLSRPFLGRKYARMSFPLQLRRRLEALGPTYIKFGQILSLREDILPAPVTSELKNLLDRLPALPFERYSELIAEELNRPVEQVFGWIEPRPLGSASIGQIHQANLLTGEMVILKLVKPGIRETLKQDAVLLKIFGSFLQLFLSRYQPRRVIDEFLHYTSREADMRLEADNAETFSANFEDQPDVVFPKIWRRYTTRNLLVMEFLNGLQPGDARVKSLSLEERERIVDLGASAIIRMLYRDGFFHADLHPGNLLILPGPKAGFIDLGMVGRFDEELRRKLLYYYYCLVLGDAENASRYLVGIAEMGPRSDPKGFRRDVEEICRRWKRNPSFDDFSIGRLILESVGKAADYRLYFPVELVLMVKAIITFEAVGHQLVPGFDVARASRPQVTQIFLNQFSPLRIARESLRGAPELVDALVKAPMLVTEGLRAIEQHTHQQPENPFTGIRGTVFAGFCIVAGAIVIVSNGPWPLWAGLFGAGALLAFRRS